MTKTPETLCCGELWARDSRLTCEVRVSRWWNYFIGNNRANSKPEEVTMQYTFSTTFAYESICITLSEATATTGDDGGDAHPATARLICYNLLD